MIALNLRELSWDEMVSKLEYSQMAPVGWLLAQKALLELTGNLEYGLRILSFAAWIGSALLFRSICFRMFAPFVAACGFALFAFSSVLLKYAVELKHYEIDVLIATASLWSCISILTDDRPAWRSWAAFAVTAAVGAFVSFGGLFAVAGCGLTLLVHSLRARRTDRIVGLCAIGVPCLLVFVWLMLTVYRPMVSGSGLTEGGADAFFNRTSYLPLPTSLANILWLPNWAWDFLLYAFTPDSRAGAALLIGGGLAVIFRRQPDLLFATIGPLAIGLLASAFNAYPMLERLALFTLPGLCLAMTFSLAWLTEKITDFRAPSLALIAIVLVGPITYAAYNLRLSPPYANQDIHPVMKALNQRIAPSDRIYVSNLSIPAWLLYREAFGLERHQWTPGRANFLNWPCLIRDMPFLAAGETVWVIAVQGRMELDEAGLVDPLAVMGLSATHELVAATDGVALHKIVLASATIPSSPLPTMECGVNGPGVRLYPPQRFQDGTIFP